MAGNSGGPWGGGGNGGGGNGSGGSNGRPPSGGGNGPGRGPGRGPGGDGPQIPDVDQIVRKGQEQLRVLMGGRSGGGRGNGSGTGGSGPEIGRGGYVLIGLGVIALWLFASLYSVKPEQKGVELFLGKYYQTTNSGLHLAPWPLVKAEIVEVTRERTEDIGVGGQGGRLEQGLMLTGDENIVDIDFQVVWNITEPSQYLFTLRDPEETIKAVAESAMREIIAQSELAPILNKDRGAISTQLLELIQGTLDNYHSGVNIVRVNFEKADPPKEVIDAFREVQAAEQKRDTLEKQADAYANRVLAGARGEAAKMVQEAEGYRAQVVNQAEGEASRFNAVYAEYAKAPEVTRKRLYIETMERVLGGVNKFLIDDNVQGQQGVVPYLPLTELQRSGTTAGGSN